MSNKHEGYVYSLRFTLQPGFHEEEKLDLLLEFCNQALIDDVMFFINCEELNRGHLTRAETEPWIDGIETWKSRLSQAGISTSINPWTTMLHTDRGRTLREGQEFRLMVDPYGRQAKAVACPLCEIWRAYLADIYAYYATVRPWILWVEDDFRLHNHGPLAWGGCFCEAHMQEYSRRAGKQLTREELVSGMIAPGDPHALRKAWLDTSRDTMIELARLIGQAVHGVSPQTMVGLMSSGPAVHSAEGRDWAAVLGSLSGNTTMVDRVHLPAYDETTPQNYYWRLNTISRFTQAVIPESTLVLPELENFPFGRYSDSHAFTRFKLESASVISPAGITLNIFDMIGNGVRPGEDDDTLLAGSKDYLTAVLNLGLSRHSQTGIKVLVNPHSSYTLHTETGASIEELYPRETFWAGFLSAFGIAATYSTANRHARSIVAISGQYFRNLDGTDISALFHDNYVLLEAEAAYTLFEMGYGRLAGIMNAQWHPIDQYFAAYEQVSDGNRYAGLPEARVSAQCASGDFLEIDYDSKSVPVCVMKNSDGESVGPGMTVYDRRVFVFPYGRLTGRNSSHLNSIMREILQHVLSSQAVGEQPVLVREAPYVCPTSFRRQGRLIVFLCNASHDAHDTVRLATAGVSVHDVSEVTRAQPVATTVQFERDGDDLVLKSGIGALETKLVLLQTEGQT